MDAIEKRAREIDAEVWNEDSFSETDATLQLVYSLRRQASINTATIQIYREAGIDVSGLETEWLTASNSQEA